jgi:hypothetical protein
MVYYAAGQELDRLRHHDVRTVRPSHRSKGHRSRHVQGSSDADDGPRNYYFRVTLYCLDRFNGSRDHSHEKSAEALTLKAGSRASLGSSAAYMPRIFPAGSRSPSTINEYPCISQQKNME